MLCYKPWFSFNCLSYGTQYGTRTRQNENHYSNGILRLLLNFKIDMYHHRILFIVVGQFLFHISTDWFQMKIILGKSTRRMHIYFWSISFHFVVFFLTFFLLLLLLVFLPTSRRLLHLTEMLFKRFRKMVSKETYRLKATRKRRIF